MMTWPFGELILNKVIFRCSREGLSEFTYSMDARGSFYLTFEPNIRLLCNHNFGAREGPDLVRNEALLDLYQQ